MKRDMDLIRKMILLIEDSPEGWAPQPIQIEGYNEEQIDYHAYLLIDAGLAKGETISLMDSAAPKGMLHYLTWAGHDFADACRNETIWNQAKRMVKEKAGTVTFELLKELLVSLLRKVLGI